MCGVDETVAKPLGYEMTWNGQKIGSEAGRIVQEINAISMVDDLLEANNLMTADRA